VRQIEFEATVARGGRDRVTVPVPFDPDQLWGAKDRHHVTGTVSGMRVRAVIEPLDEGFGFVLGCTSLFASALVTAGVGPWLPYQMLVSAWVGMGAGLLPRRVTGRIEIVMLAAYGVVSAYAFGLLMNLSGWPFALGIAVPGHEGSLDFVAGAPLAENLQRFAVYTLLTSTGSFDTGRAITNALAIAILGPAVLVTLRRAQRRAEVHRVDDAAVRA